MSDTKQQLEQAAELLRDGHMSAADYETLRQLAISEGIEGTPSAEDVLRDNSKHELLAAAQERAKNQERAEMEAEVRAKLEDETRQKQVSRRGGELNAAPTQEEPKKPNWLLNIGGLVVVGTLILQVMSDGKMSEEEALPAYILGGALVGLGLRKRTG